MFFFISVYILQTKSIDAFYSFYKYVQRLFASNRVHQMLQVYAVEGNGKSIKKVREREKTKTVMKFVVKRTKQIKK